MKTRLLAIALLAGCAITSNLRADGWTQSFRFFWPETVNVRFEGQWSPLEKRAAIRCLDGNLVARTMKPIDGKASMLWTTVEEKGRNYALIERPATIIEGGNPHVIIRRDPALRAQGTTTLPTAGLPVTIRIRPEANIRTVLTHEAIHLGGGMHDHH